MKWFVYVIILFYLFYRAVSGVETNYQETPFIRFEDDVQGKVIYLSNGIKNTVSCVVNKDQQAQWLSPNGTVIESIENFRVFSEKSSQLSGLGGDTLDLVLANPLAQDSGVWQCNSEDKSDNVTLCVNSPVQFEIKRNATTGQDGQRVTLTCQLKCDSDTDIKWYRNGKTIIENGTKYKIWSTTNSRGIKSRLRIYSLKKEDVGKYTCTATHRNVYYEECAYFESYDFALQVYYAPQFAQTSETVYVINGKSVKLTCKADGYPKPNLKWYTRNNSVLSGAEFSKDSVVTYNDVSYFNVFDLPSANESIYCAAINIWGRANKEFRLIQMKPPMEFKEVKINQLDWNGENVKITLMVHDEETMPISGIHVELLKKASEPTEADWANAKSIHTQTVFSKNRSVQINLQLLEGTDYWVRVAASNEAGVASWSAPVKVTDAPAWFDADYPSDESPTSEDASSGPAMWFYGIAFGIGAAVIAVVCMCILRRI